MRHKLLTESLSFTVGMGFSALPAVAQQSPASTEVKPNVIIINVDDLGYGDIGCYGATKVKTPNIDRLASQGRSFTDAHSSSAVSTPSRYGLMTGQYPCREDIWGAIFLNQTLQIDTARTTIADVMKRSGYATAIVVKWHLGFRTDEKMDWNKELAPGPLELGFDYYFGVPILNSHPPFVYVENHHVVGYDSNDPFVRGKRAETEEFDEKFGINSIGGATAAHRLYKDRAVATTLKDRAVQWIKEHKDSPFFLYYATTNIHHPFTPAERFVGTSEAGPYGDSIHELDWVVGEIMRTLDEEGLAGNTLLIFTSDNGGMLNHGGQRAWKAGHHINGKLLGFKFGAWEGGHRIPMIARWPGRIPAGSVSNQLMSNVDMLATLAALTGYELQEQDGPDSFNMLPALIGNPGKMIRDHIIICPSQKSHLSIRKGKWVYIPAQNSGGFTGKNVGDHDLGGASAFQLTHRVNSDIENARIKPDAPSVQLYNLEEDPYQTTNVYEQHPKVARRLARILEEKIGKSNATRK